MVELARDEPSGLFPINPLPDKNNNNSNHNSVDPSTVATKPAIQVMCVGTGNGSGAAN